MDADWLEKNVVEVTLPHGEVWYQDDEMPGASKEGSPFKASTRLRLQPKTFENLTASSEN